MSNIVELKKVNKTYKIEKKEIKILDSVDLKIKEGEFIVISGSSGSGKSTLLKLIGALEKSTSGQILINEVDISNYKETELTDFRAENIGFVFEEPKLLSMLTVKENIKLAMDVKDIGADTDLKSFLKEFGFIKLKGKFPHQLTNLEKQKVQIAMSLAKKSKLILCDEPTGRLYSNETGEVVSLLKKQTGNKKDKTTVIFATHNLLFESIADTVIKLKDGKVVKITKNKKKKNIEDISW